MLSDQAGSTQLPARILWAHSSPTNAGEWDLYEDLLLDLPRYLGQLETRLRTRAELGTLPPKQVLLRARTACLAWLAGRPFTTLSSARSPWQSQARAQLDACTLLDATEKAHRTETIDRILSQSVGPAYQQLAATLDELLVDAPEAIAVFERQGGRDWYRFRLKAIAGEPVDPDDLHNLGLREVARLRDRVRAIQAERGSTAPLSELLQAIRESEAYPAATMEAWQQALDVWQTPARERIHQAWPDRVPGVLTLEPNRLERLLSGQSTPEPATARGQHTLSIAQGEWQNMPAMWIEPLLAFAGPPGGHLRREYWRKNTHLPPLLRHRSGSARAQGWDLYATRLALDWKLYSSPQAELGQTLWELWCAALLVCDTGIHQKDWTAKEAEAYLGKNSPLGRNLCAHAVRDLVQRPAVRCAPTLGLNQILDLREWCRAQMGARFDLMQFHGLLLDAGPLPMAAVRERLLAWIAGPGK